MTSPIERVVKTYTRCVCCFTFVAIKVLFQRQIVNAVDNVFIFFLALFQENSTRSQIENSQD